MSREIVRYPDAGCIVEFMEGNAPQLAWIMEAQTGRLRLLLPNRRETRLSANRLLPWAGPSGQANCTRDEAIARMDKAEAARRQLLEEIDVLEIWEMSQGEVDRAPAVWFAELLNENPGIDAIAAMGRALLACKSHFKFYPPDFEVLPAAVVEARRQEQEATARRESLVRGGGVLFKRLYDIHCKRTPSSDTAESLDEDTLQRMKELLLKRIAAPEASDDQALWQMLAKGLPDDSYLPLHLAIAWGLVPEHHNLWLDRAGYVPGDSWAEKFASEVEKLIVATKEMRLPRSELPFVSIDSPTTRDIDDAFYVQALPDGAFRLHLALACPALCWPFGSAFDRSVFDRSTSIYLPEATHHMLPEILGTDAFSLCAGQARPALLCVCDIDNNGEIVACEPSLAEVSLTANLFYHDCEEILNGRESPVAAPYADLLRLGGRLAEARRQARIKAGAVIMDRPDPEIVLQGEGADIKVSIVEAAEVPLSQLLVSEMMILASAALARWAGERGLPLLHRTQDIALPPEYAGVWTEPQHIARIIRAMAPASLELTPRPHAGLGISAYSPVTSPLRRYPDMLNEAQIISWLRKGEAMFTAKDFEGMLPALHMRLEAASQAQRFRPRYWKLLYVRQHGDKEWHGAIITEVNDAFVTVVLPKEQIFVRSQRRFFWDKAYPGQSVQVRLGKVNPLYNEIQLLEALEDI